MRQVDHITINVFKNREKKGYIRSSTMLQIVEEFYSMLRQCYIVKNIFFFNLQTFK